MLSVRTNFNEEHIGYSLEIDLQPKNAKDTAPSKKRNEKEWEALFIPDDFAEIHKDMSLTGNKLSQAKLRSFGVSVSRTRTKFRNQALKADEIDN